MGRLKQAIVDTDFGDIIIDLSEGKVTQIPKELEALFEAEITNPINQEGIGDESTDIA